MVDSSHLLSSHRCLPYLDDCILSVDLGTGTGADSGSVHPSVVGSSQCPKASSGVVVVASESGIVHAACSAALASAEPNHRHSADNDAHARPGHSSTDIEHKLYHSNHHVHVIASHQHINSEQSRRIITRMEQQLAQSCNDQHHASTTLVEL